MKTLALFLTALVSITCTFTAIAQQEGKPEAGAAATESNGWSLRELYRTLDSPGANRPRDARTPPHPGPLPQMAEREISTPPSAPPTA